MESYLDTGNKNGSSMQLDTSMLNEKETLSAFAKLNMSFTDMFSKIKF